MCTPPIRSPSWRSGTDGESLRLQERARSRALLGLQPHAGGLCGERAAVFCPPWLCCKPLATAFPKVVHKRAQARPCAGAIHGMRACLLPAAELLPASSTRSDSRRPAARRLPLRWSHRNRSTSMTDVTLADGERWSFCLPHDWARVEGGENLAKISTAARVNQIHTSDGSISSREPRSADILAPGRGQDGRVLKAMEAMESRADDLKNRGRRGRPMTSLNFH